jgi:hypothetical protein
VSQHDESTEPAQRPNRKRRHEGGDEAAAQPLQLVETQAAAPAASESEDDLPRRTRPRRRRGAPAESGPLQIVETQGDAAGSGDGAPTP